MRPADFGHRFMHRVDYSGWWMFGGMVLVVALWSLLIWLVVSAVRRTTGPSTPSAPPSPPAPGAPGSAGATAVPSSPTAGAEQILAERLARGEIDPDEYRQRLDALRATSSGAQVPKSDT